jgi:hypothetical protein
MRNRSCPGGEAGARVQLGGGNAEKNTSAKAALQRPPVSTGPLGRAIRDELRSTAPADRAHKLDWIARYSLLMIAREVGVERAAEIAYAMADALAGARGVSS